MEKIIVEDELRPRIDIFLKEKLNFSRNKVQNLIKTNNITVNEKYVKNNYRLNKDDILEINDSEVVQSDLVPTDMEIDIVYEDEDVFVINKKSGMVVHPANGHESDTLVNALMSYSNDFIINNSIRPGIVHRIDKDTSGLLVVAKNEDAYNNLAKQIKDRKMERYYIALVDGVIEHKTGTIDAPIGRSHKDRKKLEVTNINSKSAITHFKVLERFKNATLIECKLDTGRMHQIRVHMQYIGNTIVNDPVYGKKQKTSDFGQMLHAFRLSFYHPRTGEKMTFEKNPPHEFYEILDSFKNL